MHNVLFDKYAHVCNANVITSYTNSLYGNEEDSPTYNEFRDMFSSGQVLSKLWIVSELINLDIFDSIQDIVIAGSWYGSLGMFINQVQPNKPIKLLDIDPRCEKFIQHMAYNIKAITPITGDMYVYKYNESLVINTSCEHIPSITEWLSTIPPNTIVVLQSNNHTGIDGHINCVHSVNEFKDKANLSDVLYEGELELPMYTRYMIIGVT